jgi:hypothetical protein
VIVLTLENQRKVRRRPEMFPIQHAMGDEGAAVSNCLLCDSYALLTLGLLPDRKLARGIKGRAAHEDLLEAFQEKHALREKTFFVACSTCNAFASASDPDLGFDQVKQGEYLRDGLAVLTPCHLVVFDDEELPPVYRNEESDAGKKPKWRLTQGVGPAGLELDRTRTGRLHKNSLRPFGIDVRPLSLPDDLARDPQALARAVREACAFAEGTLADAAEAAESESAEKAASAALRAWRAEACGGRPVLEVWAEARSLALARASAETARRMHDAAEGNV